MKNKRKESTGRGWRLWRFFDKIRKKKNNRKIANIIRIESGIIFFK